MFGTVLTLTCTGMHLYVFWRISTLPFVRRYLSRKTLLILCAALWAVFFIGRVYGHGGTGFLAWLFELAGMNYLAALFLCFLCFLAVDGITVFGFLCRPHVPALRGAALVVGGMLSALAVVRGFRSPVVEPVEVALTGLPSELDGTVMLVLCDLHLGALLDESWLADRVAQVEAEKPDVIGLLGDVFEGHGHPPEAYLSVMRRLSAPLGVYAVRGNHDPTSSLELMQGAGIRLLRGEWTEIRPGLVLVGVDSARREEASREDLERVLADLPRGASILLSHKPQYAETAARYGVGLMLSGHTHGGQVWPFGHLVRFAYPFLEGRYEIDGMPLLVSRGTGTWGPRMRLWSPGQIVRLTLRSRGLNAVEP